MEKKCKRILIPTSDGRMKIIHKDSQEYSEILKLLEASSKRPGKKLSLDYIIKEWGSLHDYFLYRERMEEKERRENLFRMYPKWKAYRTLSVEKAWKRYKDTGDFDPLYYKVKELVDKWSGYYGRCYSNFWLSRHDFEEVFWLTVKQAADRHFDGGIYFYVGINKKLKDRGTDILRMKLGTNQGYFEHTFSRIPNNFDTPSHVDTAKEVANKLLVKHILNNPSLTQEEQKFLYTLYCNPGASFQELAELMGYSYREKARRMLLGISKKLEKYREDALVYDIQYIQNKRNTSFIYDNWESEDIDVETEPCDVEKDDNIDSEDDEELYEDENKLLDGIQEEQKEKGVTHQNTSAKKPPKKKRHRKSKNRRKDPVISYPPGFDPTSVF